MISISKAEKHIWENLPQPITAKLKTSQSLGFVVAEDIHALRASPGFTNSAMDGFAVKWEDVKKSSEKNPVRLNIIGESQAGMPFPKKLNQGEAVRINTGAKIPQGSDTVIPIEDCHDSNSILQIVRVTGKNQAIRFKGEEYNIGSLLVEKGSLIHGRQLALLISTGIHEIEVFSKPSLSLIVTGSELISHGQKGKDYQIYDINTPMLSALINESGGRLMSANRVPDDFEETMDSIRQATEVADILVISGGVSVGPHDFVKKAAEVCGYKKIFWKINQKPGKPFYFARNNNKLIFGLPGNPVSAYLGFYHYIRPVIAKLCGRSAERKPIRLTLGHDYFVGGRRQEFLRVTISDQSAHILSQQSSHMMTSLSSADGYIIADGNSQLEKGMVVDVYCFPDRKS